MFSWRYGLERADLGFKSLQRTGSVELPSLNIKTGIPAELAALGAFAHRRRTRE